MRWLPKAWEDAERLSASGILITMEEVCYLNLREHSIGMGLGLIPLLMVLGAFLLLLQLSSSLLLIAC